MIPVHENDYGEVHFEDAYNNDYQQGRQVLFTNAFPDDGDRRAWRSARNIYQPDIAGYTYAQKTGTAQGRHMVPIGEVSKPHEYYGTNKRFYETNGPNPMLQNIANGLPRYGEQTMITSEKTAMADMGKSRAAADMLSSMRVGMYSSRH